MISPRTDQPTKKPWIVKPVNHRPLHVLGQRIAVLAGHEATGSVELFLHSAGQGMGPMPHVHAWDEAYYILEGQMELLIKDEPSVSVMAGELAYVPGGTVHGFRITSPQARFLSINSAGGASKFFADMAQEVGDSPDVPKIVAVSKRNGVTAPPPPGAR